MADAILVTTILTRCEKQAAEARELLQGAIPGYQMLQSKLDWVERRNAWLAVPE